MGLLTQTFIQIFSLIVLKDCSPYAGAALGWGQEVDREPQDATSGLESLKLKWRR
jgi:hypothetical protein